MQLSHCTKYNIDSRYHKFCFIKYAMFIVKKIYIALKSAQYILSSALYLVHSIMYILSTSFFPVHSIIYQVHSIQCILSCAVCILSIQNCHLLFFLKGFYRSWTCWVRRNIFQCDALFFCVALLSSSSARPKTNLKWTRLPTPRIKLFVPVSLHVPHFYPIITHTLPALYLKKWRVEWPKGAKDEAKRLS